MTGNPQVGRAMSCLKNEFIMIVFREKSGTVFGLDNERSQFSGIEAFGRHGAVCTLRHRFSN